MLADGSEPHQLTFGAERVTQLVAPLRFLGNFAAYFWVAMILPKVQLQGVDVDYSRPSTLPWRRG